MRVLLAQCMQKMSSKDIFCLIKINKNLANINVSINKTHETAYKDHISPLKTYISTERVRTIHKITKIFNNP